MIRVRVIEATEVEVCYAVEQSATVVGYLHALAAVAQEVAARPWLLPIFTEICKLVPSTILQLARDERRIAA